MIARAIRYAGPSAAIRARFGGLLGPNEYKLLLNAVDVLSFLSALRTTSYAAALDVAGRSFGFVIDQHWIARTESVASLLPRDARGLCLAYLAKREIDALKTLLRGIARAVERRHLASMIGPLPSIISFPLKALASARGLGEAVQMLRGTAYGKAIAHAAPPRSAADGDDTAVSVLHLEHALDRWFFARMIGACRPFSTAERRIVGRLIGSLADTANLLAVQRLRRTFHLGPDAAADYLVPHGFRLDARKRRALCEWDGVAMPPFFFGGAASGESIRISLLHALCTEAAKPLFAAPFQAGVAIAYILLTEMEASDMVAIYEGKNWAIGPGAIAQRMIRFTSLETGLAGV